MSFPNTSKNELVEVLSHLQSHWNTLEIELLQLTKDIQHCEECLARYGEYFRIPLQFLKDLKKSKKNTMKEIIRSMEGFKQSVNDGKYLIKNLNHQNFTGGTANKNNPIPSSNILAHSTDQVIPSSISAMSSTNASKFAMSATNNNTSPRYDPQSYLSKKLPDTVFVSATTTSIPVGNAAHSPVVYKIRKTAF